MLIVAKQDNVDNLYAVWDTVTDRFLGVNLGYNESIGIVMDYTTCSYKDAESRVDHSQSFDDVAECIYSGIEPDYAEYGAKIVKDAIRIITNHYKRDNNFRNAFLASISSALKELPEESYLEDVARAIADRIIGEE